MKSNWKEGRVYSTMEITKCAKVVIGSYFLSCCCCCLRLLQIMEERINRGDRGKGQEKSNTSGG
jgi:hypothetical protein